MIEWTWKKTTDRSFLTTILLFSYLFFYFSLDFNNVLANMMIMTNANVHALQVHHETYLSQIKDALNVNGGDIENATGMDYVMHFLTFGWKVSIHDFFFKS